MTRETTLEPKTHGLTDETMVEVRYGGQLIGCIYPGDGPGIRFISKHEVEVVERDPLVTEVMVKR